MCFTLQFSWRCFQITFLSRDQFPRNFTLFYTFFSISWNLPCKFNYFKFSFFFCPVKFFSLFIDCLHGNLVVSFSIECEDKVYWNVIQIEICFFLFVLFIHCHWKCSELYYNQPQYSIFIWIVFAFVFYFTKVRFLLCWYSYVFTIEINFFVLFCLW